MAGKAGCKLEPKRRMMLHKAADILLISIIGRFV